jgi:uncharacterized membrane protein HdeD (DUF308 family)
MRQILIVLGAIAAVAGIVCLVLGVFSPALIFGFWGVFLVIGTVFERVIYKKTLALSPGPGWQRTTERFVDDQTGRTVTVYIQPATGERAYVHE